VSSGAERRGVGRALLDAADAWCRARTFRLLTLNVFAANAAAKQMYERAGFGVDTVKYLKQIT